MPPFRPLCPPASPPAGGGRITTGWIYPFAFQEILLSIGCSTAIQERQLPCRPVEPLINCPPAPERKRSAMGRTIEIYDTTLRDGTQAENFNLSVDDKIRITHGPGQTRYRFHRGRLAGLQSGLRRIFPENSWGASQACENRGLRFNPPFPQQTGKGPQPPGPPRCQDAGHHHLRQELGCPCPGRPAYRTGRTIS